MNNSRPIPRPLQLVSNSAGTSGLPASLSASPQGPLSAPLSLSRNVIKDIDTAKSRPSPRRQSSISYKTGSSKVRSLGRSNSVGAKVVLSSTKEGGVVDENSIPKPPPQSGVRETEPVTLAEKHADLLRFIAQKESKCLELRTQLVQHEADLLLLKRKWERIVSKGSPSTRDVPMNVGGDMLEGFREGVQSGLGKVLAVLEPSLSGPSSTLQSHSPSPTVLKSGKYSEHLTEDTFVPSSKRTSISTASSSMTRDRSSLSGSRSSASSLFDELDHPSPAPSAVGDGSACISLDTERTWTAVRCSKAVKRSSSSLMKPPSRDAELDTETPNIEEDPSSKRRRPRPSSINLSQSTTPLSVSLSSGSSTPLSKQMANWVPPGLNKKWEELKGSETLSKQSKRASILLSDVLAVLAPPISASPMSFSSRPVGNSKLPQTPSHHTLDSAFFDPMMGSATSTAPVRMSPSPSPSLLDEEDECSTGCVLQPEVKATVVPRETGQGKKVDDKDDEGWNW